MIARRLFLVAISVVGLAFAGGASLTRCTPAQQRAVVAIIKHRQPFLICVRRHESDRDDFYDNGLHDGGYQATNGTHFGAYQFAQATWDHMAAEAGYWTLPGRDPRTATVEEQDAVAWHDYVRHGPGDWAGSGCY